MLKKLIILLSVFAIESNLTGAWANFNPMRFITPATREDLVNAEFDGKCSICQDSESDINMLFDISMFYKANCRSEVPHIFHRDCILGWINAGNRNCPMCRGPMDNHNANLVEVMVDRNVQNNLALIDAIRNGRLGDVRLLLDRGADINARSISGANALHLASINGRLNVVQFLLDRGGFDVNARTNNGGTALTMASQNGHLGIVQFLLDRGVEIDARTNARYTALIIARLNGHQRIADLLIAHGAVE